MRFCDIQNNHNSKLTSADKTRQDFSDITNVETVVSLYIFKKKITANPLHCRKMTVDIGHYFRLHLAPGRGGGGCTALYGLYGDVPLDRVWVLTSLS